MVLKSCDPENGRRKNGINFAENEITYFRKSLFYWWNSNLNRMFLSLDSVRSSFVNINSQALQLFVLISLRSREATLIAPNKLY